MTDPQTPPGWTDIGEAQPTPPNWLIRDLLPDGLVGITGPAKKARKSAMALAMSLAVTGKPVDFFPPFMRETMVDGHVLYVSAEARAGVMAHTARKYLGVKLVADGSLLIADDAWQWRLDKPDCRKRLLDVMNEVQPVLTVFDPMRRLHALDENDSGAMSEMMYPFRQWAIDRSDKGQPTSILWVHHMRKLKEDQRKYQAEDARGTGDWVGMSDGMLIISPMGSYWSVEAIFKLADGWTRDLVFGLGGQEAHEVVTADDRKVMEAWGADVDIDALARILKMSPASVRDSVAKLTRNQMLGSKQ